jgi:hypothetical protein
MGILSRAGDTIGRVSASEIVYDRKEQLEQVRSGHEKSHHAHNVILHYISQK